MEPRKAFNHVLAGIIIAGILIVYSLISYVIFGNNASSAPGSGWITYLIILGGLVFFIYKYGSSRNFYASFGELFSYGFKATSALTFIFVIFLVLVAFAIPDLKEKAMEATQTALENQRGVSQADKDKTLELTSKYFWVFMIGGTVFFFVIIGTIGSLLGAAITKKKPYNPLEQNNL